MENIESLEQFSPETLNEMEMQAVLGGGDPPSEVPQNCNGGFCAAGCGLK